MNFQLIGRVLILAVLASIFSACGHDKKERDEERPAVRVKTMTVASGDIDETATYSGTVEEESATAVSFSTAGTIKTLTVGEGQTVRKGQLIGTLDDGTLRSAYEIAKATLHEAKDAYARMSILHEANSLPDMKWVEVQSKLSQAENAAEIARLALEDAKLYAPVSGIVAEKVASIGETVAPGMPVVKIVDINAVKIGISVPENEISKFAKGSEVRITTQSHPDAIYTGTLVEKGVTANPLSRSYMVKYQVNNAGEHLLPGMICEVKVEAASREAGTVLPVAAVLLAADNTHFVWLDSAGVARKRIVEPGAMLSEGILINAGLKSGDKVITAGMEKVSQGMKVVSIK